jgi:hypothetical protein
MLPRSAGFSSCEANSAGEQQWPVYVHATKAVGGPHDHTLDVAATYDAQFTQTDAIYVQRSFRMNRVLTI